MQQAAGLIEAGDPALDQDIQPLMTIREAASLLHVHLSTLRRWEKSGWLTSTRVGPRGHRRYAREAVMKLAGRDGFGPSGQGRP